jgi:hypothetical protein
MSTLTETIEDLRAARALIADEDNWGKNPTRTSPPSKVLCALFAVYAVAGTGSERGAKARDALTRELRGGYTTITQFNDARTTQHADVLALFDRAIKHLEAQV